MLNKFLIIFIFLSGFGFALEPAFMSTSYDQMVMTDDYALTSFQFEYRTHRRDMNWPYPGEASNALDWGVDYLYSLAQSDDNAFDYENTGHRLRAIMGQKLNANNYFELRAGGHELASNQILVVAGKYEHTWSKNYLRLSAHHDYAFVGGALMPESQNSGLEESVLNPYVKFRFHEKIHFSLEGKLGLYSDDNVSQQYLATLHYGILQSQYWLWINFQVSYLDFTDQEISYWSPENFLSYGPQVELTAPLYKDLSFSGALSYYNFTQTNEDDGTGYYLDAGVLYGQRDKTQWKAAIRKIESTTDDFIWEMEQIFIGLNKSI